MKLRNLNNQKHNFLSPIPGDLLAANIKKKRCQIPTPRHLNFSYKKAHEIEILGAFFGGGCDYDLLTFS